MIPAATGRPASAASSTLGKNADADHHEIGRDMPAVAEADAGHLAPSLSMLVTCTPR
jgi:hypothetical protein